MNKSQISEKTQQIDGLSIIVPCFNEEGGVTETISSLKNILKDFGIAFEILAVDDGSEDATLKRLEEFGDSIKIISNTTNLGYGASLKRGLIEAKYQAIGIIDADGTYPVDQVPGLYKIVAEDGCDMAVGARTGKNVAIPLVRLPAKYLLGKLANFIVGQNIPDMNSGLRVFRRSIAMRMYPLFPDGFSFTTTITLAMLTNGYDVKFVPTDYFHRVGSSKIRPIRDTLNFIQLIVRVSLYFSPLKVFTPLSIGLLILAVGWGLTSYFVFGQLADVSTLVLFVSSLQVAVLGMLAEMINLRLPRIHEKNHDQ